MRCKFGKLKNPTGGRRCKKAPAKARRSGKSLKGAPACRYGRLKNPTGGRVCKKKPGGKKR